MPGISRPKPIPSEGVEAGDVATAVTSQLRLMGQVTAQGAGLTGAVRTLTAAASISSTDLIVRIPNGITATLPMVGEYSRNFWLVKAVSGIGTLAARGSDTIDGGASISVTKMRIVYAISNSAWESVIWEN